MKKSIYTWTIVTLFFACSCGNQTENEEGKEKNQNQELRVEGSIVGIDKFWYNENGRIVSKTSLKIRGGNQFDGEIVFKNGADDSSAVGILITDRERVKFNQEALFKNVSLVLIPAGDLNSPNAFYIKRAELQNPNSGLTTSYNKIIIDSIKSPWLPVGEELHPNTKDYAVVSQCSFKDTLYAFCGVSVAGVGFSLGYMGTDYLKGALKLNGNMWSEEGMKLNGVIRTTVSNNDELIVGGSFTRIGNTRNSGVAKYSNNTWLSLGSDNPLGRDAKIMTMKYYNNELYVGGIFSRDFNEDFATNIAKWNGTQWGVVGKGKKTDYNNNIANGLQGTVRALAVYKNELYAGGDFKIADGKFVNGIAKWNGSEWLPVGLGFDGSIWCLEVYNDELYAGGKFKSVGGTLANSLAKWNGNEWTVVNSPIQLSDEEGVIRTFCIKDNVLYIGGNFSYTSEEFDLFNLMKFDGKQFFSVGEPEIKESMNKIVYGIAGRINSVIEYQNGISVAGQFTMVKNKKIINCITKTEK